MKEIIGAMVDGRFLTSDPRAIADAVETGRVTEWLDRRRMQFMAACDLGPKWGQLAESKTLFCLDDDGNPLPPNVQVKAAPAGRPATGGSEP